MSILIHSHKEYTYQMIFRLYSSFQSWWYECFIKSIKKLTKYKYIGHNTEFGTNISFYLIMIEIGYAYLDRIPLWYTIKNSRTCLQKLESVFTKVIYVRIFILSFIYSRWSLITWLSKLNEGILHKHITQILIVLYECMKRIFNHELWMSFST